MSTNGQTPDLQVDPGAVIEALGQQIARLTVELAVRDAAVAGIRAELEGVKAALADQVTESANRPDPAETR